MGHARPVVGVFDSGVGGLSVYSEVRRAVPYAQLAYCADNANFPYGLLSADAVTECCLRALSALVKRTAADLLVVACNTASTASLPVLRRELAVPVVGVVPAVKPAASLTRSGVIGVLATPRTVASPYLHQLREQHAAHCRMVTVGSSLLVEMAEAKLRGVTLDVPAIAAELSPFLGAVAANDAAAEAVDVIVLGCTHFPLLAAELAACMPNTVRWLDSGAAIANRVRELLPPPVESVAATPTPADFYCTRLDAQMQALQSALAAYDFASLRQL